MAFSMQGALYNNAIPIITNWNRRTMEYSPWIAQSSTLPWLSANPGCGKSMLLSTLVDQYAPGSLYCYFFKDSTLITRSNPHGLCALLHQICELRPELMSPVLPVYLTRAAKLTELFEDLWSVFADIISREDFGNVVCILDAIDECSDDEQKKLLQKLAEKGYGISVELLLRAGADKGVDVNTAGGFYGDALLISIVDIVAVYGLHRDPMNTWMSRETNVLWLKDFLPHDVPLTRVMSIAYNDDAAFNKQSEDVYPLTRVISIAYNDDAAFNKQSEDVYPLTRVFSIAYNDDAAFNKQSEDVYPLTRVMSIAYNDDATFNKASEDVYPLIMRAFSCRKSLLLHPLVTRQSRKIPRGTAQHYSSTIQHYASQKQSRHDNLCRCAPLLKYQHHSVYCEKIVWCYLLQYFIGLLIAREKTLEKEYCTIDATDGGRTCHPLRELWRRRPKASISMLLTPARRMWGKTADLLSYQHLKLAIPILMLWVKPTSAKSCESSERIRGLTRVPYSSMSSYYQLLLDTAREVLRLWANPHERSTQNSPTPQTLLLGCFLCTSLAVIVAYIHRNDRYQAYFLVISSMLCVGEGAFFAAEVQDFVFRYLLLGVSVGLGLSALFHRGMAVRRNLSRGRWAQEKSLIAPQDEKTQGWGDEKLGMDGASM